MMHEIFLRILNMSISTSWLVLAVLVLRVLLKKAPKWVNVLLWGLVAIRLILPISIESSLSMIPDWKISVYDNAGAYQPSAIGQLLDSEDNVFFEKELTIETGATGVILDSDGNILIERPMHSILVQNNAFAKNWIHILSIIWLTGIFVMSAYTLLSYICLNRKVSTSFPVQKGIRQSECVESPFVLGVVNPVIYLPCGLDEQTMTHVIAHEQAHIRRKDHWWKPIGFALLTIHWFNPLMWLGYILLCRDIELACDEKVIAKLGNVQRADYTRALVVCSLPRFQITACPLAFGEVGVKARVKSVMNYRKPTFWIVATAVVVCFGLAICFLTDPIDHESAREWFDYTEDNSQMSYDRELTTTLREFPGVTFCYLPGEVAALTGDGEKTRLFDGMPIWSVYFSDLNGDGKPEICAESSFGSGMIDERIIVYDYANSVSYLLSGRGEYDYYLRMDDEDGCLYADKCIYNSKSLISSERLRLEDLTVMLEAGPQVILMARVLEIHDGYFLVEPVEAGRDPDRIEVSMKNMEPSPEIVVGDTLQIEYDGQIAETYPAKITSPDRISVAEQAHGIPMIPTDTELTGLQAGVLLVPMDGNVYRYNLQEVNPQNVTAEELLFSYEQSDMGKFVGFQVFSLKEYPTKTKVLLVSDHDGTWLCEYSPPRRCADTALDDAVSSGYVVMVNGSASYGQELWQEFYELTQQGKAASVTVAHYYDGYDLMASSVYGYYQVFRQDYPCMDLYELSFDGSLFTLSTGAATASYEYLMKYTHGVTNESYEYILTHDQSVTFDELWQSIASSQFGAYIDHRRVYSEPIN